MNRNHERIFLVGAGIALTGVAGMLGSLFYIEQNRESLLGPGLFMGSLVIALIGVALVGNTISNPQN